MGNSNIIRKLCLYYRKFPYLSNLLEIIITVRSLFIILTYNLTFIVEITARGDRGQRCPLS